MEKIIEFIGNNYVWFLTITIILLFALIGYIYDNRKSNVGKKEVEEEKDEVIVEEVKMPDAREENKEELKEEAEEVESTTNTSDVSDDEKVQ